MSQETQRSAEEFAKNYPVMLHDTALAGPVTVGNVTRFTRQGDEERVIVNLCLRTAKSGSRNASISFPSSWTLASKFQKGDLVNVTIEGGYVRKIYHAKPEVISRVSASSVNAQVAEQLDDEEAEKAVDSLIKEQETAPATVTTEANSEIF